MNMLQRKPITAATPDGSRFSGNVDVVEGRVVKGWICDQASPIEHFSVDLLVDGEVIGSAGAKLFRDDLLQAGIGDGEYGFAFELPKHLFDGAAHILVVRERESGWYLPGLASELVLDQQHQSDCSGALWGIAGGQILGFVYDRQQRNRRLDVALVANGVEIVRSVANERVPEAIFDPDAPQDCAFRIPIADLRIVDLLDPGASIRVTHEGFSLGSVAGLVRDLVHLQIVDASESTVSAALHIGFTARRAAEFDVFLDDTLLTTLRLRAETFLSRLPFKIPLGDPDLRPGRTLSVRFAGADAEVAGSPQWIDLVGRRNLVANSQFARWAGSSPVGWIVDVPPGISVAPTCDLFANVDGAVLGPSALVLNATDADVSLWGTSVSQKFSIGAATTDALDIDVLVGGRADKRTECIVTITRSDRGELKAEASQTVILGPRPGIRVARLRLPETQEPGADITVSLRIERGNPRSLQLALLACGLTGFLLGEQHAPTVSADRAEQNAIRNAEFKLWSKPFRQRIEERRVEAADGWIVTSKRPNPEMEAWLTDVLTRDTKTAREGSPAYGLAVLGKLTGDYARVETTLDKVPLIEAEPQCLSFFCRAASSLRGMTAEPQSCKIREIFIIDRWFAGSDEAAQFTDRKLLTIARNLLVQSSGEVITLNLSANDKQTLQEAAQQALYDSERRELVLAFEGTEAVDWVFADARLGPKAQVENELDPVTGYIGLEDSNVISQLKLIKGIEDWGRPVQFEAASTPCEQPVSTVRDEIKWHWPELPQRSVEIVICVHDAVDETIDCLQSLRRCTSVAHTIVIVDDNSAETTREQLRRYVRGAPWIRLLSFDQHVGYTKAANAGMSSSNADWLVLINSDTIVTPGWLEGLLEVARTAPDAAMVGPLSNAASWQSVPDLHDGRGDWKINQLPDGMSPDDVAAAIARFSKREFPEATLLNGFCTLIKRSVLEQVGFLDELAFPLGYGEENDLCIRVRKAGYKLYVADHVFVYHLKSASFGHTQRRTLSKRGTERLLAKHPDVDIQALQRAMAEITPLIELRKVLREHLPEMR